MLNSEEGYNDKSQKEDLELPLFDLAIIANSTNNFSIDNKLGEGGFGPVYKGILEGGQEIAEKLLSKNSNQGLDEFKNEVICIAKLQHRNLVKLLGCCIQGEEKMLIYEYMPNKSLDFFIFAFLYSGYIAPEYAVDGLFSVKSDVFSFGVLVLEVVSRKRNRGFYHPGHRPNLLGHAWRLYKEGRSLELIDEALWDSCYINEVLRSIHVGLLCVQQCLEDRPSMSYVVLMLGSEGVLPQVKQPGFFTERNIHEAGCSSSKDATVSAIEITITLLDAR
ncbi:G-type lectin S-receptor-like serine/threonine-protein kinase SD1-1 [Camellia sinensis]|nr:G-type lectin S-receptor-like serine/threonine-protein kinase SD1-1 [Camellia sinensis]